jgi:two-component system, sensor histidine kinase
LNPSSQTERLERRLERERLARKQAEQFLEQKSLDLFEANQALRKLTGELEEKVKTRTEELERALVQAEHATRAKSDFLATMSHEIRTPLHGILGSMELLSLSGLNPDQLKNIQTVQSSGRMLLGLINDILDISKIEAGRLNLESRDVDLLQELQACWDIWTPLMEQKGLSFDLMVQANLPRRLKCDSNRISQIFMNLMSNALKFTKQGTVAVQIRCWAGAEHKWILDCKVRDSGVGMSQNTVNKLFQPFSQGDSSTTRQFGGTGLGLVICKRLCQAMGGDIHACSMEGQGSEFQFTLMLDEASPVQSGSQDQGKPHSGISPHLGVLVADDNQINRMLAQAMLKQLGLECTCVNDGREALQQLQDRHYDVVFMDMQMPDMDGLQATRAIRQLERGHQPLIIAMTANAYETDQEACQTAGMNAFLSKPYSIADLKKVLRDLTAN